MPDFDNLVGRGEEVFIGDDHSSEDIIMGFLE